MFYDICSRIISVKLHTVILLIFCVKKTSQNVICGTYRMEAQIKDVKRHYIRRKQNFCLQHTCVNLLINICKRRGDRTYRLLATNVSAFSFSLHSVLRMIFGITTSDCFLKQH
jgi:hypothetical protein